MYVCVLTLCHFHLQIPKYFTQNDPSTDFDWSQMVYNIDSMVNMEQNSVTNMMEAIQTFNFSRVGEAVEVIMNKMTEPTMNIMSQLNTTSSMKNNMQSLMRYYLFVCGPTTVLVNFGMEGRV